MNIYKRYLNNVSPEAIGEQQQNQLINSKVIVMGAGALGSVVIANLVAMGIEDIKIIDNEILTETDFNASVIHKYKNIGRARVISAKDWIQEYNPNVKVEIEKIKFNEWNYFSPIQGYDIIVDCLENTEDKYFLNRIAVLHKKILVHGQTNGFFGHVTTIIPNESGCLECLMVKPKTTRLDSFKYLAPVASVIASIQANEVLKIITKSGELLTDKLLMFDGIKNEFKILTYSKSLACEVCSND